MVFDTSVRVCRWLKSLPKPLAMFCVDDYLGLWICDLCRRLDIHVPEEVAILGVGNDDMFCEMSRPHLSSIAVPSEQVGYKAARLLDAILCDPKAPKRTVLLPPIRVITRQSTDVMAIDDCRIVEAVRFIREHANERIRVEKVAKEVSLPRRMLERRFRAALHRSPFAEIRRVQIENVKMFLAQTDKTLETIAPECGFSDVSRMGRAFRETVKMSPGAYRKQYRNH
jgi:LacI family transcriptional regulator